MYRIDGADVDSFSCFPAKVKSTVLPRNKLIGDWEFLRRIVKNYSEPSYFYGVLDFPYRDNWFKPYILKELAYIKTEIEKLDTSQQIKNFFLACFSSVIRQVSEADNNCTRTVVRKSLQKKVIPKMAINLFVRRTDIQVESSLFRPYGKCFHSRVCRCQRNKYNKE